MAHSFSQPAAITCPSCQHTFDAQIWLIVDGAEHPDLIARARDGTLHHITCPRCGHAIGTADVPLLIYRPDADPPLLFSPANATTREEDREQAAALLARLRDGLGDAWQEEWVAAMPVVPRPLLAAMLSDDPEAAMCRLAEEMAQAIERLREEDPDTYRQLEEATRELTERLAEAGDLGRHLWEFIAAATWDESRRILEQHPELLTDEADALLGKWIEAARTVGAQRAVPDDGAQRLIRVLEQHRDLLRRCRQVSVEAAFAEMSSRPTTRSDLQQRFQELIALQQHAENHPEEWPALLQSWQRLVDDAEREGETLLAAAARGNMGNTLLRLYEVTGVETWALQAEALLEEISRTFTRKGHPQSWAMTQHSLGTLFARRYERSGEEAHAHRVRRHYCLVLAAARHAPLPPVYPFRAGVALTRVLFHQGRWQEIAEVYRETFEAFTALAHITLRREDKESWLREGQTFPGQAAYAFAQLGKAQQAMEVLEAGRAILLREALERSRQDLERLAELGHSELLERYRTLTGQHEALIAQLEQPVGPSPGEGGEARPPAPTPIVEQLRHIDEELKGVIAEIRRLSGYEDFLRPPTFERIARAAEEAPLVYLLATPAGGLALVVYRGGVEAVELDFTEDHLDALLVKRRGEDVTGGYLPGQLFVTQWLMESLEEALPLLGERVMGPVAAVLRKRKTKTSKTKTLRVSETLKVFLIPAGHLALLPLHAARYRVDGREVHFLDEFDVAYAPSAQALLAAQQRARSQQGTSRRLVGVGNPLPHPKPLPFARAEVEEIASLFAEDPITFCEEAATKAAVLDALPAGTYVHLACHGQFNLEHPLESHLQLADQEPLTLREIVEEEHFQHTHLVVLSACQTAVTEFRHLPNEVIGLPAGLVQAGAAAVVGTLWSVADLSTALVMVKFYEYHLRGDPAAGEGPMPPVRALRRAQGWLRDVTAGELLAYFRHHKALQDAQRRLSQERWPEEVVIEQATKFSLEDPDARPFAHPYYWAPFLYIGG